ncbi:MAG: pilus assembly protein TadG-related protein [Pseudomonadota bacterium]
MHAFVQDDAGAYIVWNLLWVSTFLMIGGLALDSSNAWRVRGQLQHTADAAALAAALYPTDEVSGKTAALQLTELNMPASVHGNVMSAGDVEYGFWDEVTKTFSPLAIDKNAVRVIAGRLQNRANGLDTYLLKLAGVGSWDVSVQSIAMVGEGEPEIVCPAMMIASMDEVVSAGFSEFNDGVCLHAAHGVATGLDDLFPEGARLGAPDEGLISVAALRFGSANVEDLVAEEAFVPTFARVDTTGLLVLDTLVSDYWLDFSASTVGTYYDDPDAPRFPAGMLDPITLGATLMVETGPVEVRAMAEKPDPLPPGDTTIYVDHHTILVVDGDVDLIGDTQLSKVAIITSGHLSYTGSAGLHMDNVFLLAAEDMTFDASVTWGDANTYCGAQTYNSHAFAQGAIDFDGSPGAYGVMAAARVIQPGEGFVAGGGYLEAVERITIDPDSYLTGCDVPPTSSVFSVNLPTEAPIEGALLVR